MDHPSFFLPSTPRFLPQSHARTPSRSPTRPRIMDDMLSDLSPSTTLEAFTSASGALSASIEAASPAQRAFGIRAAIASKKIQEWQIELSAWPWPTNISEGFDIPASKRKRLSNDKHDKSRLEEGQDIHKNNRLENEEYWGCLPAHDVLRYESRIEEISEDMEELNVEEIKSQVLSTHIGQRSPTPSLPGHYTEVSTSKAYTGIDDFTAVVTATVLQALPSLSRLMALMDVWSVRLTILRQVSPLTTLMEDAEVALKSGWNTIQTQEHKSLSKNSPSTTLVLSRQDYEIMRDVLQAKISKLGQKLDYMLDTLEGRNDTLPETWLDRMETIEQDYGEWVVYGERKVYDGEWQNELSRRREEQLQSAQSFASETPPVFREECSVSEEQDSTDRNGLPSQAPEIARELPVKATISERDALQESPNFDIPVPESLEKYPNLSLFDGPGDDDSAKLNMEDVSTVKNEILQPKELAESTNHIPLVERAQLSSPEPHTFPSAYHGEGGEMLQPGGIRPEISPSDVTSDKFESKVEDKRAIDPAFPIPATLSYSPAVNEAQTPAHHNEPEKPMTPEEARQILTSDQPPISGKVPSNPVRTPPSGKSNLTSVANVDEPSNKEQNSNVSSGSQNPKLPCFGHPLANSLRRELHQEVVGLNYSFPYLSPDDSSATIAAKPRESNQAVLLQNTQIQHSVESEAHGQALDPDIPVLSGDTPQSDNLKSIPDQNSDTKSMHIDLPPNPLDANSDIESVSHLSPGTNHSTSAKGHTRGPSSVSMISGYATSEPSPILYEAEPTEYFRPVSPPIIAKLPELSTVTTPVRSSYDNTPVSPNIPESGIITDSEVITTQGFSPSERKSIDLTGGQKGKVDSHKDLSRRRPVSDPAASITNTGLPKGRISQDGSTTSEVSTINERLASSTSTPTRIESPEVDAIPRSWHSQFVSDYDGDSPSIGRFRLHNNAGNYSPGDSPLLATASERHSLQLHRTPSFDTDLFYSESPSTPGKPPIMSNVESSPTPGISSPSKHTDDQLQLQISEILESIPARIRLTSEPDMSGLSDIKQPKKRISLNPFSRPSSRAATPSFTLAPVYAKNPRPRPQNGNPEIKLYHLSRSTGEAPIKLFVRLVGEKGERVMVRVGGGWADLGEYLKEYASHHGRRSDQPGKVEIQDLPPRAVSTSSTTSTTTLRNGTWNTSEASSPLSRPGSRPASALGRPLSSLAIRKTRKSVGEEARENAYRSPSTPLSPSFRQSPSESRSNDTPTSVNSARSVSQMSWREEESSLGLAGPRSRKGEISAENAAWVESMKEKVRIASVEKDKKDKTSFGEMGQVGATKRLFKKGG